MLTSMSKPVSNSAHILATGVADLTQSFMKTVADKIAELFSNGETTWDTRRPTGGVVRLQAQRW